MSTDQATQISNLKNRPLTAVQTDGMVTMQGRHWVLRRRSNIQRRCHTQALNLDYKYAYDLPERRQPLSSADQIAVLKFGGTSVKNIGRIRHVCDVIESVSKSKKVIVVVSAMGDTTDTLLKLANQCVTEPGVSGPDVRELDLLLATGEQVSVALVALCLRDRGIRARSFTGSQIGIVTDNQHSCARVRDIDTDLIEDLFVDNDVLVVAGFQGISENGSVTTLGRGGSDTTAVALAAAVGCKRCDIYTDVDGVYSADPNVDENAEFLTALTYDEMLEKAQSGAQVVHGRAVDLAKRYGLRLQVRNTFNPQCGGTQIDCA
jgi:aspartate kinase